MSVQKPTQFSASRTILCFAAVAFSYAILLIDAAPAAAATVNAHNATIEVPIAAINTSQNTPELIELATHADCFSLKINFPLLRALNRTIYDPINNDTIPAADDAVVIVSGIVSVDLLDIGQRVVVNFEADRHGNAVKFHLEPAIGAGPRLGANTLKNTAG